jgi:hypothetical protein
VSGCLLAQLCLHRSYGQADTDDVSIIHVMLYANTLNAHLCRDFGNDLVRECTVPVRDFLVRTDARLSKQFVSILGPIVTRRREATMCSARGRLVNFDKTQSEHIESISL